MFFVYIITNKPNGTLYTGMTDDLERRMSQHKQGLVSGFARKYGLKSLVWYQAGDSRESVLFRERQIKNGTGLGRSDSLPRRTRNGAIFPKTSDSWMGCMGSRLRGDELIGGLPSWGER